MARDRVGYEAVLSAVGVCVATRIPFLLWGEPGAGKTAVVESATLQRLARRDARSARTTSRATSPACRW